MVCLLLLHAHSIIHFLCAVLHVFSKRRKDSRGPPGSVDRLKSILRRVRGFAPELFQLLPLRYLYECDPIRPGRVSKDV